MSFALDDPIVQSSLLPLLVALLLTGVLRFALGAERGVRMANLSVALSFMLLLALVQGVMFPPAASSHKLLYIVGAFALVGAAMDYLAWRRMMFLGTFALLFAAALWWLNLTRWARADTLLLAKVGLLYCAGILLVLRLYNWRRKGLLGVVVLLAAALGFGAIALMGSSAKLATLSFTLAAALGGFALWNWPHHRYPLGAGLLLGGAGGLLLLTNQALLLTQSSPLAIAALLLLLWVDVPLKALQRRWPFGEAVGVVVSFLLALLLAGIAVGVSLMVNPIDMSDGY